MTNHRPVRSSSDANRLMGAMTTPTKTTGLTAPERETVITTSDDDDTLDIWTAQRPVITKLRRNPAATLVSEGSHGSAAWARFTLPADLLTFRSGKRSKSDEQRAAAAERMRAARESREGLASR